jgi:hypothetical protein
MQADRTKTELWLWHDLVDRARRCGQPSRLELSTPWRPNWMLGLAPALLLLFLALQWIL